MIIMNIRMFLIICNCIIINQTSTFGIICGMGFQIVCIHTIVNDFLIFWLLKSVYKKYKTDYIIINKFNLYSN